MAETMHEHVPLTVYVHLPWCVRKCPYCDFNSHALRGPIPEGEYVDALLADLSFERHRVTGRSAVSVFFGGGTPSLFSPASIARIIDGISMQIGLDSDAEITLEANPGATERGHFAGYRAAGINRISLGVQSFDDTKLSAIGRIHNADTVRRALDELHCAGVPNINLDLMYGLPQQTLDQAITDLNQALAAEPTHLSHYQLTLEPNTPFWLKPPPVPDADVCWDMQSACQTRLSSAGFIQYEVSSYAQSGQECRHNRHYWEYGDYLGIGAGAHGKLTLGDTGVIERHVKQRHPRGFMDCAGTPASLLSVSQPDLRERSFEFMLNALRLRHGFTAALFEQRTGRVFERIEPQLRDAKNRGLLHCNKERWSATPLGYRFLNDLQVLFLPDPATSVGRSASSEHAKKHRRSGASHCVSSLSSAALSEYTDDQALTYTQPSNRRSIQTESQVACGPKRSVKT